MKNICNFFILALLVNLTYGQARSILNPQVAVNANTYSQYIMDGNNILCKADSLGNSIWVKDFNGKIAPQSPDSNHIGGPWLSGSTLFLKGNQIETIGGSQISYPCIIVLDTNGNVLATKYDNINTPGSYYLTNLFMLEPDQLWLADVYSTGNDNHFELFQVDSQVNITASYDFWFNSSTNLLSLKILPDSSIAVFTYSVGLVYPDFQFVRIDKYGNKKVGVIFSHQLMEIYYEGSVFVTPSRKTVVLYNVHGNSVVTRAFLFDFNGAKLIEREWPDSLIGKDGTFSYSNNQIVYDDGNNTFRFDSLLIDSCLGPGQLHSSVMSYANLSGSISSYGYSSNFLPANAPPMVVSPIQIQPPPPPPPPPSQDYCLMLSTSNIESNGHGFLTISPNPSVSSITLKYSNPDEVQNIAPYYRINDLTGKLLCEGNLLKIEHGQFTQRIDIGKFEKGVYLITVISQKSKSVSRFVKE